MRKPDDPRANGGIHALDADFGALAEAVGTIVWNLADLTPRECAFLCLAGDVCAQTLGLPFQLHVAMAHANGATRRAVKEVLLHLAPDAGYVRCLQALIRLKELDATADDEGQGSPDDPAETADERFALTPAQAGTLRALDAPFGEFASWQLGTLWSRPGLTRKERAYLSLAVDVCEQTLDGPFALHVDLALAGGATPEQVRDVLRFMAEYGLAKAWRALAALAAHPVAGTGT